MRGIKCIKQFSRVVRLDWRPPVLLCDHNMLRIGFHD